MKVWELTKVIKMNEEDGNRNPVTRLEVETRSLRKAYGTVYKGELIQYGGVDGRLGDIPSYLGGEEVIDYHIDNGVHYITI